MRKFLTIIGITVRNALASRGTLLAGAFGMTFRVAILFAIYAAAYRQTGGSVQGLAYAPAAWSMGLYFVLLAFGMRRIARDISQDVLNGSVELRVGKPLSFVGWAVAVRVGRGIPDLVLALACIGTMTWIVAGAPPVPVSLGWAAPSLALIVGGTLTTLCVYTCVGLTAFWIEDSDPVFWIVDKAIMVLGGSFVPVALFPDWLRSIADYTPLGAALFATRIFTSDFAGAWPRLVGLQLLWMTLSALLMWLLWRRASLRLSVNGG